MPLVYGTVSPGSLHEMNAVFHGPGSFSASPQAPECLTFGHIFLATVPFSFIGKNSGENFGPKELPGGRRATVASRLLKSSAAPIDMYVWVAAGGLNRSAIWVLRTC